MTDASTSDAAAPTTLGDYLLVGVFIAFALCLVGTLGMTVGMLAGRSGPPVASPPARSLSLGLGLVFSGFFAAGLIGAAGAWALRPLRRSTAGWVASGVWVAACAFGLVGLGAVLAFTRFGIDVLGFGSPEDAWASLVRGTAVLALGVGIPGGLFWRHRERGLRAEEVGGEGSS